jgi:hypothetical protein
MHEPSPTPRHPVPLKVLAVTVALGFLGTVVCTAGGSGTEASQPVAARPAAQDGGSGDAGEKAASAPKGAVPEPEEKYFPATKAAPLHLMDGDAAPQQAAPRREPPTQTVPR